MQGFPSARLTLSPGSHMANPFTFFKTLSKCYLLKEVSPDHYTSTAKAKTPPFPTSRRSRCPLLSATLFLPKASVLLAYCMIDRLCLSVVYLLQ